MPDVGDQGFAAVDALVALMILSTTIVLTLGAVTTARRASERSSETRHALALLRGVIDGSSPQLGTVTGRAAGFDWRLQTRLAGNGSLPGAVHICERAADARAETSGRRYALSTAMICSADSTPS